MINLLPSWNTFQRIHARPELRHLQTKSLHFRRFLYRALSKATQQRGLPPIHLIFAWHLALRFLNFRLPAAQQFLDPVM